MPTSRDLTKTPPFSGNSHGLSGQTPPQASRSAEDLTAYVNSVAKSYYYDPSVFPNASVSAGSNSYNSIGASAATGTSGTVDHQHMSINSPQEGGLPLGNTIPPVSPTAFLTGGAHFRSDTPPLQSQVLSRCAIVTGNSHPQLAVDVASLLGKDLHPVAVTLRSSGEINIKILESVNDKDVFIVHSMCAAEEGQDINEGIMELMLLIRKMRQGYAASVTAVVPFMAYGRQDHKTDLRVPISSSSIAMMMMQMGVDRVVALDLHSGQIQGAFNAVPVDSLSFLHEFAQHIRNQEWLDVPNTIIVSPDAAGVERAKRVGDVIGATSVVTIVNRRIEGGKVDCMQAVGEVRGKSCIIVDDIIDSGKTLIAAAELLKTMGAIRVIACVTHGVMSGQCPAKIAACDMISELIVSDSIPQHYHKSACGKKLVVLPTAPLIAMSILQGLRNSSAGSLYTGPTDKEQLLKLVHAQLA